MVEEVVARIIKAWQRRGPAPFTPRTPSVVAVLPVDGAELPEDNNDPFAAVSSLSATTKPVVEKRQQRKNVNREEIFTKKKDLFRTKLL